MRRYETIFIVDPDLSEEDRTPIFSRLNDLIPQEGGFLVMQDDWGSKRLAYEIKKKHRGYYVRLDYCGTGAVVDEMERFFRIDDRVLKYMTVMLEKDVDVDSVKEEMARAASEAEAAEKAALARRQEKSAQNDKPDTVDEVKEETAAAADEAEAAEKTAPAQRQEDPSQNDEPGTVDAVKEETDGAADEAEAAEKTAPAQRQEDPAQNDEPDTVDAADDNRDDEAPETEIAASESNGEDRK